MRFRSSAASPDSHGPPFWLAALRRPTMVRAGEGRVRVTIIDFAERGPTADLFKLKMSPNYASVMPQSIAVWCEQLGHDVRYVCYTGCEDIVGELARDTDVLFVGAFTLSALVSTI